MFSMWKKIGAFVRYVHIRPKFVVKVLYYKGIWREGKGRNRVIGKYRVGENTDQTYRMVSA